MVGIHFNRANGSRFSTHYLVTQQSPDPIIIKKQNYTYSHCNVIGSHSLTVYLETRKEPIYHWCVCVFEMGVCGFEIKSSLEQYQNSRRLSLSTPTRVSVNIYEI